MKKAVHTTLKFLLILTIFLGLQGKVIIRYLEIFHKNHKSEIVHSDAARVKKAVIYCKLQCYTEYFQTLGIPLKAFFVFLITGLTIVDLLSASFKEKLSVAASVRLFPLRAPPAFNHLHNSSLPLISKTGPPNSIEFIDVPLWVHGVEHSIFYYGAFKAV